MTTKNGPFAPPDGQPVASEMGMVRSVELMDDVRVVSTAPPE